MKSHVDLFVVDFQKASAADVGKVSVERAQKVQTRGLFSDDEDTPVRLAHTEQ